MIQQGQYQNEIKSLSALDLESFERIFKIFEESLDNKDFYVCGILNDSQIVVS